MSTLCDTTDCKIPGSSVLHHLPEFVQIHVHWVSDATQPFHPLSPPSPSAFNLSQHQVFSNESALHTRWSKYWSFSFSISPSVNIQDWFPLGWTCWIPFSPRDSQESSPTLQFKSINSLVLSFLYIPTLTSIHDYWKNHSLYYMNLCWQNNVSVF